MIGRARDIWSRFSGVERGALIALFALTVAAVVVPLMSRDPLTIGDIVGSRILPPGTRDVDGHFHMLGTDRFGRDLFARMMLAGRISLAVGWPARCSRPLVGTALGSIAAWQGGIVDRGLMAATDVLLAIPRLVLLLVCASLWRPGTATVVIVLVATGWMGVARLIRGEVLGIRARPYIESAEALGVPLAHPVHARAPERRSVQRSWQPRSASGMPSCSRVAFPSWGWGFSRRPQAGAT